MNTISNNLPQSLHVTDTHVNSWEQGVSITQNGHQPLLEPTKVNSKNSEQQLKGEKKFFTLSHDRIVENEFNFYEIPPALIEKRTKSIQENGLRTRLKVTDHPYNKNNYLLYGGHCNFRSGIVAGMTKFKVEYTHFNTKEDMLKALVLENETRDKTKKDEANEIKFWKEAWGMKQGSRSDIKGEDSTNTRKRLARKFDMGEIQIDQTLNVLKKRENLFHLMDRKMLSIGGADNIIKFLEKRDCLHITETEMIQLVIDAVIPVKPKISEEYKSGKIPLEIAFRDSASSLGKLMEAPQVNQAEAVTPRNSTIKSGVAETLSIASSTQDKIPVRVSMKSLPINKVRHVVVVQPVVDKDNDIVNRDNIRSNENGIKQEDESIKESEGAQMTATPSDAISTTFKNTTKISTGTLNHVDPIMLYVKDSTGNFVPYTCKCEACPLNKR